MIILNYLTAQLKYWGLCNLTGKQRTVYGIKEISSLPLLSFEDSPFQGRHKPVPALEMEIKDLFLSLEVRQVESKWLFHFEHLYCRILRNSNLRFPFTLLLNTFLKNKVWAKANGTSLGLEFWFEF